MISQPRGLKCHLASTTVWRAVFLNPGKEEKTILESGVCMQQTPSNNLSLFTALYSMFFSSFPDQFSHPSDNRTKHPEIISALHGVYVDSSRDRGTRDSLFSPNGTREIAPLFWKQVTERLHRYTDQVTAGTFGEFLHKNTHRNGIKFFNSSLTLQLSIQDKSVEFSHLFGWVAAPCTSALVIRQYQEDLFSSAVGSSGLWILFAR